MEFAVFNEINILRNRYFYVEGSAVKHLRTKMHPVAALVGYVY